VTSTQLRHSSTLLVGFLFPFSIHGVTARAVQGNATSRSEKQHGQRDTRCHCSPGITRITAHIPSTQKEQREFRAKSTSAVDVVMACSIGGSV
jgi:hypothetical protein